MFNYFTILPKAAPNIYTLFLVLFPPNFFYALFLKRLVIGKKKNIKISEYFRNAYV